MTPTIRNAAKLADHIITENANDILRRYRNGEKPLDQFAYDIAEAALASTAETPERDIVAGYVETELEILIAARR